jgi:hypothetical protein
LPLLGFFLLINFNPVPEGFTLSLFRPPRFNS